MVYVCCGGGVGEPHKGRIGAPLFYRQHTRRTYVRLASHKPSKTLRKPPSAARRYYFVCFVVLLLIPNRRTRGFRRNVTTNVDVFVTTTRTYIA